MPTVSTVEAVTETVVKVVEPEKILLEMSVNEAHAVMSVLNRVRAGDITALVYRALRNELGNSKFKVLDSGSGRVVLSLAPKDIVEGKDWW